jgi:hypothetical protein
MSPRIVVHAGFHKTGTTSIQKALHDGRAQLAPATIVLRPDMIALCETARAYSVSRTPLDLGLVRYEAAALAENWHGTIILSSEDLAGHMPGRRGLTGYDATPMLMQAMVTAFRAARPGARITIVFTTRAPGPWLASCHMQHLRATRMTLSTVDYALKLAPSAKLSEIVDATSALLSNDTVVALPLEGPGDPLTALLNLAGMPPGALSPMPHSNPSAAPALRSGLLEINRSGLSNEAARAARRALMRKGGP